jgi:hypothetical protein
VWALTRTAPVELEAVPPAGDRVVRPPVVFLGAARHRDVLAEEAGPVFARLHLQCVPLDAVRDVVECDRGVVLFALGGLVEGCEAVEERR